MSQPLFVRPLTEVETITLREWTASGDVEKKHRAQVILFSAAKKTAYEISELLKAHPDNLKKWIREFNRQGLDGIAVRKRGPQGRFTREQIEQILDLYRQPPRRLGFSFDYWTPQKLANVAVERGIVSAISHVTMRQIMREIQDSVIPPAPVPAGRTGDGPVSLSFEPGLSGGGDPAFDAVLSATASRLAGTTFEELYAAAQSGLRRGEYSSVCQSVHLMLERRTVLPAETEAEIRCWHSEALEGLGRYEESLDVVKQYEDAAARGRLSDKTYARVRLRLGFAYARLGISKAKARLEESLHLFTELEDYEGISAAHYGLGYTYCEHYNEFKFARDHLNRALDYEQLLTNPRLLARIYLTYGVIKFNEGAFVDANQHYGEALRIARQIQDHRLLGVTLMNLGTNSKELGEIQAADGYFSAALEAFKHCPLNNFLARTNTNSADGLIRLGRWTEAERHLAEAMRLSEQLNAGDEKVLALITSGELRLLQGRAVEAEKLLQGALDLMNESNSWIEPYTQRILAQVYYLDGRTEQALKTLRSAIQLATSNADTQNVYRSQLALAEIHFWQQGYDQAEEYLELAREQLKNAQDLTASGLMLRLEGQLAAVRGRLAEAQTHVATSISIFTKLQDRHKLAGSWLAMGEVLLPQNDLDGARTYLDQAQTAFSEMGAAPDLTRVKTLLDEVRQGGLARTRRPAPGTMPASRGAGISDLLLISRLMEVAASRDLLVQELVSILQNHFEMLRTVVWEVRAEEIRPVASGGVGLADAEPFARIVIQAMADRRSLPPGHLVHVLEDRHPTRLVLWLESRAAGGTFDLERLKPYLKQTEMGLEYASLRSIRRSVSPSNPTRSNTLASVPGFIYASQGMCQLVERIQKIRTSDVTVLITGESGTGKELIARAVHAESGRRDGIFLPFNCATTPREMIDSQLFGHKRGSFTGANTDHRGMVRTADGGTLFLDEIGDMALEVQPKLLRFLQEGEVQPLGETKPVTVDVRVIAATNADLEQAVREGRFREDLYYRLNIIHLHVPALRERREEIPLLAAYYLDHFSSREGKQDITFSPEALHALSQYAWPGNVRQLRTEVQRVVAYMSAGDVIRLTDLSSEITNPRTQPPRLTVVAPRTEEAAAFGMPRYTMANPSATGPTAFGPSYGPTGYEAEPARPPVADNRTLREVTDEIERRMIADTLQRTGYNVSRTARELGLSRRGLKLKMEQLGIDTNRVSGQWNTFPDAPEAPLQ